jgi:hypothetical protein
MTSGIRYPRSDVRRVLVLSHTTGYQLRAFNDAADALGVELVFATDRCHKLDDPWQDRAVPIHFHDLNASVHAVIERHLNQPVSGIVAVGDRPVTLAARVAEAIGLPWHSVNGAIASTDKRRSRATLTAAGLPSPAFFILSSPVTAHLSPLGARRPFDARPSPLAFPLVVKPVGLSGSRGVIRADDPDEFEAAVARIRALVSRPEIRAGRTGLEDEILVEEYIEGREFAVEGVMTRGVLRAFAIFDKPDPLAGPFFEETIYVTPTLLDRDLRTRVIDHVARGANALGLRHGPIHAECRITADGDIYVLEIAGRPIGGLCSRVLTLRRRRAVEASGPASDDRQSASLEQVLLRHALSESADEWVRETPAAAVMMIPIPARGMLKQVGGQDAARAIAGVTDVRITAKIGQRLEPLPEAGSYLGFIFAKADQPQHAEHAVRSAHARLTFDIAPEISVNR